MNPNQLKPGALLLRDHYAIVCDAVAFSKPFYRLLLFTKDSPTLSQLVRDEALLQARAEGCLRIESQQEFATLEEAKAVGQSWEENSQ
jgi:hypothetical protein